MSTIVYHICALLEKLVLSVPVGTNLGLLHPLIALVSGRFLQSRGAIFPALSALKLSAASVRRAGAALCYGRWQIAALLGDWRCLVVSEGVWRPHIYEGLRPVACDLVGFFRPHLAGCAGKHYQSAADKALPAVVLALVAEGGSVGTQRLALPHLLLRQEPTETTEADFQRRVLWQAAQTFAPEEALIVDAGVALSDLLDVGVARFVVRLAQNATARRNRPPVYGERVRPLKRKRTG
ncbi:MAG TPA: hypothetical protein VFB21_07055 [Chthonomonadaceae bacterium]|nr:hypothetical protein [Chthonomonadaceae bacterium]